MGITFCNTSAIYQHSSAATKYGTTARTMETSFRSCSIRKSNVAGWCHTFMTCARFCWKLLPIQNRTASCTTTTQCFHYYYYYYYFYKTSNYMKSLLRESSPTLGRRGPFCSHGPSFPPHRCACWFSTTAPMAQHTSRTHPRLFFCKKAATFDRSLTPLFFRFCF